MGLPSRALRQRIHNVTGWAVLAGVVTAATLGIFVRSVHALDVWTDPYVGVRHLHRVQERLDVHVLLIDLSIADLSLVSTRPQDRGMKVQDFAARYGADIAINANFFHWNARSCGLAAGDGVVWSDSYKSGCVMSLGFGALNQAMAFESGDVVRGPLPSSWMNHVVTGKPWLIRDGLVHWDLRAPRHMSMRNPRTAIGLTRDRQTLILLVADGRRPSAPGLTGVHMTALMEEFGAHDAINLDGGGSTQLFVASEGGVQNRPSDSKGRIVSNHLGIRVRASAEGTLAGFRGPPPPLRFERDLALTRPRPSTMKRATN